MIPVIRPLSQLTAFTISRFSIARRLFSFFLTLLHIEVGKKDGILTGWLEEMFLKIYGAEELLGSSL